MDHKETNRGTQSSNLKNLSAHDFLNFGIQQMAYIRRRQIDNKTVYVIHAADGTELTAMEDINLAITTVRHNELETATVH